MEKIMLFRILILFALVFSQHSEAAKKRNFVKLAPSPKTMAAPKAVNSEVKAVLLQESLDPAINWIRNQKARYEQRHIFYFDTADLDLAKKGLTLRLRRKQDDSYESTVKIRQNEIHELPFFKGKSLKKISCEMDLQMEMEDKVSCSFSKTEKKTLPSVNTDNPDSYFDSDQARFARFFDEGFKYPKLKAFGRINSVVWELDDNTNGDMAFEVWTMPDGRRIGEFSLRAPFTNADKATETLAKKLGEWGFKIDKTAKFKTEMALQTLQPEIKK